MTDEERGRSPEASVSLSGLGIIRIDPHDQTNQRALPWPIITMQTTEKSSSRFFRQVTSAKGSGVEWEKSTSLQFTEEHVWDIIYKISSRSESTKAKVAP